MKTMRVIVSILVFTVFSAAVAQRSVVPPPKPANDAPANAEVLKLLRAGMSETVVLNKIRSITDKFDTSADALVTLKQAGANDAELSAVLAQGASPAAQQSAAAPADNGPSLAETMQFIRDKVNQQGSIVFVDSESDIITGENHGNQEMSFETQVVTIDQAGGLSLQQFAKLSWINQTNIWQMYFKDVGKLEVLSAADYGHNSDPRYAVQIDPPFFVIVVHLTTGKTIRQHRTMVYSGKHGKTVEDDKNDSEFILRFHDEETADRVAKAMLHAVELCGGGNKEKF